MAVEPFLNVERAVHENALRKGDERRSLRWPSGAPATQSRGVHVQASGEVTRRIPGVGQEGRTAVVSDGDSLAGYGVRRALLLLARLTICGICYRFGRQVRWISGRYGAPKGYGRRPSATDDTTRKRRTAGFRLRGGGKFLLMDRSAVVLGADVGQQSSAETPVWPTVDVRLCSPRSRRDCRSADPRGRRDSSGASTIAYMLGKLGAAPVHAFPMTHHVECVAILEPAAKGS